jgi:hypothetical protein
MLHNYILLLNESIMQTMLKLQRQKPKQIPVLHTNGVISLVCLYQLWCHLMVACLMMLLLVECPPFVLRLIDLRYPTGARCCWTAAGLTWAG